MIRKYLFVTAMAVLLPLTYIYPQEDAASEEEVVQNTDTTTGTGFTYPQRDKIFPSPKRPAVPSSEKIQESERKNAERSGEKFMEETRDTFSYGLTDEISNLLDTLTQDKDCRFTQEAYDLFQDTKSPKIRQKVLAYFAALEDPCLEDYAVEIINEPYEQRTDIVNACFNYIRSVKSKDAIPGLVELLDKEEEAYFSNALVCLGEVGGPLEAQFLAQYIDRDDLSTQQKQSLVRVLGNLKAVETWDKLCEIAEDTDQDLFARCYAAESIGAMEKAESEPVLIDLYEADEPRLREYVIRGLSHYSSTASQKVIVQALKDDNYRVRLEALAAVQEQGISAADRDIIYHCKHKEEKVVKEKCYKVLAKLSTPAGNEYLVSVLKDKKSSDDSKAKVGAALLENGNGIDAVIECAEEALKDDKKKSLRYALGKEFAKYENPSFASICIKYLENKDPSTQGTGLDMYSRGRYSSARAKVEEIADGDSKSKKNNANAKKARRILENLYGISYAEKEKDPVDVSSGAAPEK